MRTNVALGIFLLTGLSAPAADGKDGKLADRVAAVDEKLGPEVGSLVDLYKDFHAHPELSLKEERSSAQVAKAARALGFEVTEKVGGTGVVAVLKNGPGPTVLVRADMDALPIVEQTGLPYASKVRTRDGEGHEVGGMHACGHDVNMTCLVGTARTLSRLKHLWSGTLVFIGQPAEETGAGARL